MMDGRVFKTFCLDEKCRNVLYIFPSEKTIECYHCGQKHSKSSLKDVRELQGEEDEAKALHRLVFGSHLCKRGAEMVKVLGLSNYHCKLLSPLLTRYGMDKNTGRAQLLTEMEKGEIFDCSLFGDRAFLIEPEHISIHGFGKDITGSSDYLSETLKIIVSFNGNEETLIPIHADGDGHCLVHAVSRALVGRELFWHPLRCCLKKHFKTHIDEYKELFKDFIDTDEWPSIIDECDPDFQPPEGELHGLRNIHIFGLANVLRRPIILLDSLECMLKCGDYSGLFLPGFSNPEMCRGKDNALNKPLCIAWSSYSHNHYIPLVGVQDKPLPSLPASLIPKVWGMPQNKISLYIEFDCHGGCVIGGDRTLKDAYIQRLVRAMDDLYYEKNGIHPSLVADAKLYLCPDGMLFPTKPATVIQRAKAALQDGRLYRCLFCRALQDLNRPEGEDVLLYNPENRLYYNIRSSGICTVCARCKCDMLRKITDDGTVIYKAGDKDILDRSIWGYEQTRRYFPDVPDISQKPTKEAKLTRLPLKLHWNGKEINEEIPYFNFYNNSKTNISQFVKDQAEKLIKKHFSDKSDDNELHSYIVEEIWKLIKKCNLRNGSETSIKEEIKCEGAAINIKTENSLSYHSKPSEIQYIKVCTSTGLQANLALTDDGMSYGQLQEWIKNEFEIPVKNQVIKKGVPPRLIKPSGDTNKQMLSDLRHGDRLTVEIQRRDDTPYSNNTSIPRNIIKDFYPPKTPSDMSWDSIKANPQYFRRNGLIYNMIAAKHKLTKSLHTSLDACPNKVFCYNPVSDSIELCVKLVGHFLICKDIEETIEDVKRGLFVIGFCNCPLYYKQSEENPDKAFVRAMASSENSEQSSGFRKAPGFSVIRNTDAMDFS